MSVLQARDRRAVRRGLAAPVVPLEAAGLLPSVEQVELFAAAVAPPKLRRRLLRELELRMGLAQSVSAGEDEDDEYDDGEEDEYEGDEYAPGAGDGLQEGLDAEDELDGGAEYSIQEGVDKAIGTASGGTRVPVTIGAAMQEGGAAQQGTKEKPTAASKSDVTAVVLQRWRDAAVSVSSSSPRGGVSGGDPGQQPAAHKKTQRARFSALLGLLGRFCATETGFFLCELDDLLANARSIDKVPMSLKDRWQFCLAPVRRARGGDAQSPHKALQDYAQQYAASQGLGPGKRGQARGEGVRCKVEVPWVGPRDPVDASLGPRLEALFAEVDLYLWLARRLPWAFRDRDVQQAEEAGEAILGLIRRWLYGGQEQEQRLD